MKCEIVGRGTCVTLAHNISDICGTEIEVGPEPPHHPIDGRLVVLCRQYVTVEPVTPAAAPVHPIDRPAEIRWIVVNDTASAVSFDNSFGWRDGVTTAPDDFSSYPIGGEAQAY